MSEGGDVYSYAQVLECLEQSDWLREQGLDSFCGQYAVAEPGVVAEWFNKRQLRYVEAVKKYRKTKWYLAYLRLLPGVQGIAFCNSLSLHFTRALSDVDLFLIVRKSSLWSVRLFSLLPLMLLRLRPAPGRVNAIDTNFFLAEDALNIHRLQLAGGDPYLAWWARALVPMFETGELFPFFLRHNAWAELVFPQSVFARRARLARPLLPFKLLFLQLPESFARFLQQWKFPSELKARFNQDSTVVVSDSMLKFHKNDRRREVKEWYESKLQKAGLVS